MAGARNPVRPRATPGKDAKVRAPLKAAHARYPASGLRMARLRDWPRALFWLALLVLTGAHFW